MKLKEPPSGRDIPNFNQRIREGVIRFHEQPAGIRVYNNGCPYRPCRAKLKHCQLLAVCRIKNTAQIIQVNRHDSRQVFIDQNRWPGAHPG